MRPLGLGLWRALGTNQTESKTYKAPKNILDALLKAQVWWTKKDPNKLNLWVNREYILQDMHAIGITSPKHNQPPYGKDGTTIPSLEAKIEQKIFTI